MKTLFSDKSLLSYSERLKRLRWFTALFFSLLLASTLFSFYVIHNKIEQEQFHEYQQQVDDVTQRINKRTFKRIALSNATPPAEFDYFLHLYNPATEQLTKAISPLANRKKYTHFEGLIGYFQIDNNGRFNSPAWPYILESERDKKALTKPKKSNHEARALTIRLREIAYQSNKLKQLVSIDGFKEKTKFEVIADLPEYLIFYRVVEINDEEKLQGYIVERSGYINDVFLPTLGNLQLKRPIGLTVTATNHEIPNKLYTYHRNHLRQNQIEQPECLAELAESNIDEHSLSWPLKSYKVSYSTYPLSLTNDAIYSIISMISLVIVAGLSCFGFYRIGLKQLILAEQRLNFVSSISHELKTPLTSIRMYSEMLKTGQVLSANHQKDYYDFIYSESERLSRLIDNILQLSKFNQPQHNVSPEFIKLSVLIDIIQSKVSSLMIKNDFQLNILSTFDDHDNVLLLADIDAFSQVVINITDNSIKFFDSEKVTDTDRRKIDFIFQPADKQNGLIQLQIRDYGLGITSEQEEKIFDLFYRGGSELTRTTQGTGIGLALVKELVEAQQGTIDVQRMSPGLAMNITFKSKK
ncbi:hypothetical protein SOPP22_11160 [Shewanella sp. OPT22]|nr:hypothetical protein SOPP22_11160 [Shewanella sp. OPT22]